METTKQVDETARKLRALIDRTDQRWEQLSDEERLEVLREVGELMSERHRAEWTKEHREPPHQRSSTCGGPRLGSVVLFVSVPGYNGGVPRVYAGTPIRPRSSKWKINE